MVKINAKDLIACHVHHETNPHAKHVETPAAVYHVLMEVKSMGTVMHVYACDCTPDPNRSTQ